MGWGKAKHSSAIAAGKGCTVLLCGFRMLGVAHPCLQEAGRACDWRRCSTPGVERSRSLYQLSVQGQGDKLFSMFDADVGKPTWQGKRLEPAPPSHKPELHAVPLTVAKLLGCAPSLAVGWEHVLPPSHSAGEALSPQQLCCGSQTSVLQAAPATPLGCN